MNDIPHVRSWSIQWLVVALVAAHFVFGIATEVSQSDVFRGLSLAAAGVAFLATLLGAYSLYRA